MWEFAPLPSDVDDYDIDDDADYADDVLILLWCESVMSMMWSDLCGTAFYNKTVQVERYVSEVVV